MAEVGFFRTLFPEQAFYSDVSGDHIIAWYQDLFSGSTVYASILASVMFSSMLLDPDKTLYSDAQRHDIRTYSAVGAVLFVCLVLFCQCFSLVLKFHGKMLAMAYDSKHVWLRIMLQTLSLLFQQLLLVGTVFFCLVVRVYHHAVGLIGMVITFVVIAVSFGSWFVTAVIETRSQCKKWAGQPWVTAEVARRIEMEAAYQFSREVEERAMGRLTNAGQIVSTQVHRV
nr:hypothetical protein B0A51_11914 [Rachicladosporium sp. CCFEE 5018]